MVLWRSAEVQLSCFRIFEILVHCAASIYCYEMVLSLPTTWQLLSRQRKFNTGAALYLLCRYSTLAALILFVRSVHLPRLEKDWTFCQPTMTATVILTFMAMACSSSLLYLRAVALASLNRRRMVLIILGIGNVVLVALAITAAAKTVAAAGYNKSSNIVLDICGMVQMRRLWFNFVYPFVYDIACLGTMMFFLLRMPEKSDLKSFLVSQSVTYSASVCLAYLVAIIIVASDFNDAMSDIGLVLLLLITTICATRMHRSLTDFIRPLELTKNLESAVEDEAKFVGIPQHTGQLGILPGPVGAVGVGPDQANLGSSWKIDSSKSFA